MPENMRPKRLMLSLVHEPRVEYGQEMMYGNISRAASEVRRHRGRRREAIIFFEMGNPGAGPHWLAEARHESAFRHLANRSQGHLESGPFWLGAPTKSRNGVFSMTQKHTRKRLQSGSRFNSVHFRGELEVLNFLPPTHFLLTILTCSHRMRVHY